jgi:hypothetical protein
VSFLKFYYCNNGADIGVGPGIIPGGDHGLEIATLPIGFLKAVRASVVLVAINPPITTATTRVMTGIAIFIYFIKSFFNKLNTYLRRKLTIFVTPFLYQLYIIGF